MTRQSAAKRASPKPVKANPAALRRTMEQTMLAISRLLEKNEFADIDEVNEFLETLNGAEPSAALNGDIADRGRAEAPEEAAENK